MDRLEHRQTIPLYSSTDNCGMALSHNGNLLAVTNMTTHTIELMHAWTGETMNILGSKGTGKGQLHSPCRVCFSPCGDNLLVADYGNGRVQELRLDGTYVRMMFTGAAPVAVDCNDVLVVTGSNGRRCPQISVLLYDTGHLLHQFTCGIAGPCPSVSLTPDGLIAVVNDGPSGASILAFTPDGLQAGPPLCTQWLSGGWHDVVTLGEGILVVCDWATGRLAVFDTGSPAGLPLYSSDTDPLFNHVLVHPTSLAVREDMVYVLSMDSACIHVFQVVPG